MKGPEEEVVPATSSLRDGLSESIPLIAVSLLCFTAAVIANAGGVTIGPNHYPIAGVLAVLGFISAIGAVLSWFFAGSAREVSRAAHRELKTPSEPLPEPEERLGGHPRPSVRVDASARAPIPYIPREPWDEGPAERSSRPSRALTSNGPEAALTLAELDGLREELLSRRGPERQEVETGRSNRRPPELLPSDR